MLTNTAILDPLTKTTHSPKLDKSRDFFEDACGIAEFDFIVLFIHLHTRKMRFNAPVFTLRSKVELNWTRAIRPVIAQSVLFSEIAKKLNIALCKFFLIKRKHCPY